MRVYFLSEIPCSLFIGGAYLGLVNGFERSAELDLSLSPFCEFVPPAEYLPVRLMLDEQTLLSPPEGVSLYYSGEELAIYASGFLRADQTFHELFKRRLPGVELTLFRQGKLFLRCESANAGIYPLPDFLESGRLEETPSGYLLLADKGFVLLTYGGELIVSEGTVVSCEQTLKAEVPFRDSLRHTALCEWKDGKLVSCSIKTPAAPTEATYALALFESVLIGADPSPYLADNLLKNANALKRYLKDFCSVVLTDRTDRVGLVYERKPRVFDVRYFRVELTGSKVSNLFPEP